MDSAAQAAREGNVALAPEAAPHSMLRPGKLGVFAIVFFVIAAVAPMGAIMGGGPIIFASVGVTGPLMYLLVGALFAVFSAGFVTMSRYVSNAGGFVAYISKGLGPRAGTAMAGVTVVAYLALVCGFWGFFGGITEYTMSTLGINLPGPAWIAIGLVIVTLLCYRGANVSLWALGVLLMLEIAALLIMAVAVFAQGGAAGVSLDAFNPTLIYGPGVGIAVLFAATCFTGFEATVVFSEEAREPRRTVPRAAYVAIAVIGLLYAFITWSLAVAWGTEDVQAAAATDPTAFVFAVADHYVGPWLTAVMGILLLTSLIAMFLGFHNIASRYLFALGRARVLPPALGRTSAGGTPRRAILVFSGAVVIIIGVFLLAGADLISTVYSWLSALGTVSILTALLVTSISVVAFFLRTGLDSRLWHTRIAPIIASLGFVAIGILAILNYSTLLGGTGEQARWLLLILPVVAGLGWWWASRAASQGHPITFDNSLL